MLLVSLSQMLPTEILNILGFVVEVDVTPGISIAALVPGVSRLPHAAIVMTTAETTSAFKALLSERIKHFTSSFRIDVSIF